MCIFKSKKQGYNLLSREVTTEESRSAAEVHAYWADYVVEHPEYTEAMGDYDWHMHWIDVHMSAAKYMEDY